MKAAVFSDTHSSTALALEAISRTRPDVIIHLGDYERDGEELHQSFPDIPFYAVRGNCDICALRPDADTVPLGPVKAFITHGHLYNVNADSAAAALAKALKVRKFAVVSDVPGLLRDPSDPSTLMPTLHLGDVARLKEEGVISGGMLPKIEGCEDAIRAGVRKVHLVDGRMPHSLLLEIFTREGVGTEITDEQEH